METLLSPSGETTVTDIGLSRLKHRGEIWRKSNEETASGGRSGVHRCAGNHRCDLEPVDKPSEGERGFSGVSEYVLYLPCEADIRATDQFVSPAFVPARASNQTYGLGRYVSSKELLGDNKGAKSIGDGHVYKCVQAGVTGAESPFLPQRVIARGELVKDGTVVWKEFSSVVVLEIVDTRDASSEVKDGRIKRIRAKVVR